MFGFEQFSLEMVLVLAVGLMILGPKDLPVVLRRLGQFVGKMRGMAAEFRASFDDLARQAELDDLRKEVEALRTGQFATPTPDPDPIPSYNPFDHTSSDFGGGGVDLTPEPVAETPKPARKSHPKKAAAHPELAPVKATRAKSTAPKTAAKVAAPKAAAPKTTASAKPKGAAKPVAKAAATPRKRALAKGAAK